MAMMVRYGFNIRTRSGQRVDNISIMAPSRGDAERRLRQMYDRCEIVECHTQVVTRHEETLDLAHVIELVSASEPPHRVALAVVGLSGNKSGAD
jgi:hypothetical protein